MAETALPLCASVDLVDGGLGVGFELRHRGEACRAFAVRYAGRVYAYLNRCRHVPMEMDYQPNQFFDLTGHWLICATHGALYAPASGECRGGPCRGALTRVTVSEHQGQVFWHPDPYSQPLTAP
jgi:nitrite reductase/ring-hydroxylating ferredoxin subunit